MHIEDEWEAFYSSLDFFKAVFGEDVGGRVADVMVRLAQEQETLFVNGVVDGNASPNIYKLNGFGYLMGAGRSFVIRRDFN